MESNKSRERTVDDVLTEALRYRGFWGNKGGITVSGGEALLQIDFLIALFTKAKEQRNPTVPWIPVPFLSVINHVTLKSLTNSWPSLTWFSWISRINEEQHKIVTSQTNKNILACAQYLSDIGKPVWIRHVLVPGLTDRDDDLIELGKFVKTLKNVDKFEILPYHTMGEFKWRGWEFLIHSKGLNHQQQIASRTLKTHGYRSYQDYMKRVHG